jgi:glycosyltransferase involved in cell wall biosynthesis
MVTPLSPLQPGGVQRYVWEVSTRLVARGAHVEVLCSDPGGERVGVEERDGFVTRTVRAWPPERDWCFAPGIWPGIERAAWEVIHVQSYHTLVAPLAMLRALSVRTPYVVTFHGGGHSSAFRHRARGLQRQALRPLLSRAAALVAIAQFEIELYSRALDVPRERFRLIPVGTDLQLSDDAASALSPAPEAPVLASIGRLERYKGHQRVMAALPFVLRSRPDARLLIVGGGPYESELRGLAARLGLGDQVQFTSVPPGDTGGMANLLSGVSLVVLMSEYETHPQVALEAAAARRRLLVADDGAGLRELADAGLARSIPLDSSPVQLAEAIAEQLDQPPPTVRPHLTSWDECVDQLALLYEAVARRSR